MALYTAGEQNTPSDDTVLADTGPHSAGDNQVNLYVSAAVAAKVILQRRNAANSATIWQQAFWLGALDSISPVFVTVHTDEDERIRVVTDGTILGKIQATLAVP